eukprot:6028623-Pyramimonas_sp.AAC.1
MPAQGHLAYGLHLMSYIRCPFTTGAWGGFLQRLDPRTVPAQLARSNADEDQSGQHCLSHRTKIILITPLLFSFLLI